jgi:pSer/pThr/pTyr-binding forkhead associated (FHA) protein
MVKEKDVFGDAVNTAARVEALAKSQQILISCTDKTDDQRFRRPWEEKVRTMFPLRETPDVTVKGKGEKLLVFEVKWPEMSGEHIEVAPRAPQMAGRVNVEKAAEAPPDKGTVILDASPMARVATKPKVAFSLMVVRPDGSKGQEFLLDRSAVTLGRVDGEIQFPDDPLVSRRHARFHVEPDALKVEDLNSANGIFWRLNRPHVLQDGDIVLMGRQMFRFAARRADADTTGSLAVPVGGGDTATVIGAPAQTATAAAELIRLLPGGVEEKHFPLNSPENILGRTRGSITFPEDAFLSSQHCKVVQRNGNYVLEDMHAVNGTFVAIRERTALNDGDILLIGHQLLRVTVVPA